MSDHAERRARLAAQVAQARGATVGLGKRTSNLFRDRASGQRRRLDVDEFNHVLAVDARAGWVESEGMTAYEDLVAACLPRGVMPAVVPQLKTITLGGAAAGVGIEATSFRQGLVHDTLLDFDVLLGNGEVVRCAPDGEHRDLFFGFPNSYGTLGYALRLRARTLPVRPFVAVRHARFRDPHAFFAALEGAASGDADFLDGVVFAPDEHVLTEGRFVDEAPYASDYTLERIYYRSLRERGQDFMSCAGYLWRWDTDWFWCSKNLGAQHPLARRLLGRGRLNSRFYTRVMRWNSRVGVTRALDRLAGWHRESVIQDVDIPVAAAAEFLAFFHREVGILPIWVCPLRTGLAGECALYPAAPGALMANFGFWDVVKTRQTHRPGHFNRLVERKVAELGGIKSLYSDSYYTREEFNAAYGGAAYARLKARYDPEGRLGDLYGKCVLRH